MILAWIICHYIIFHMWNIAKLIVYQTQQALQAPSKFYKQQPWSSSSIGYVDQDAVKRMRSISPRLSPSRLQHIILASLMASLSIGMPSWTRQCQLLVLQASVLFWIRQSQSRNKKAATESTIYLKVQPMMAWPPILSEDTKKEEMGGLLGMLWRIGMRARQLLVILQDMQIDIAGTWIDIKGWCQHV